MFWGALKDRGPSILDDIETNNGHRSDLATVKNSQHTVEVAQLLVGRKHF